MGSPGARAGATWIVVGTALLVIPCAALFIATAGFFAERPLAAWQGLAAVGVGIASSAVSARALGVERTRAIFVTAAVIGGVLLAGGGLASAVYDLGFDSQSYHQRAVMELVNGWNPIRGAPAVDGVYAPFVAHYSSGTWVQAALVALLTGDVEAGKVVNLVALAASFCLGRGALEYTGLASRRSAWLLSVAAALNPVSVVQAFTFYVDGYLGSMMVSTGAALALAVAFPRRLFLGVSALCLVVLANTKFTGIVFATPLLVGAVLALLHFRRGWAAVRRFAAAHAGAYAVALGFVGFHPYVTNAVQHGHPFYPLRGPTVAHTITGLRPPALAEEGRALRLVRSVFADPARPWRDSAAIYKSPFSVSAAELEEYAAPDARVGGWGPLFGAAVLVAAIALLPAWRRPRRDGVVLSIAVASLLGSALANSECWWARLAPQVALVPLVVAVFLARRFSGHAVLAVLLGNAALVVGAQALYVPRHSAELERFLDGLARDRPELYVSDRWIAPLRRLREHGVDFVAVRDDGDEPDPALESRLPCRPLRVFPGTMNEIRYCAAPQAIANFTREVSPLCAGCR